MTFWPLTNSDFPTDQTFNQFHDLYTELDHHRIMSGFHGAFATGVASQQGTLTLPDTWFRPPFWDLLMLQLMRPNSLNLPCLYSTFHLEYPLVLSRFCPWLCCRRGHPCFTNTCLVAYRIWIWPFLREINQFFHCLIMLIQHCNTRDIGISPENILFIISASLW